MDEEGKKDARKYSFDELREMRERGETQTRADAPILSLKQSFGRTPAWSCRRAANHRFLRIDSDVLQWFKEQGRGHLTRMNAVLRSFIKDMRNLAHPARYMGDIIRRG